MKEKNREIYRECVVLWGTQAQLLMVIEECSELQKEICKHFRGEYNRDKILDELTDVRLMLDQLEYIFKFTEKELSEREEFKVNRILERLEK